jgi:hypothetical protein
MVSERREMVKKKNLTIKEEVREGRRREGSEGQRERYVGIEVKQHLSCSIKK